MLTYFLSPEYTISDKLVQIMYLLSGFFCMYCGVRAWIVKANKHFLPTGLFWFTLGIVVAFGQWLPPLASGILVAITCIPAALGMVKRGNLQSPTKEEQQKNYNKIGMKIFIPAFGAGVFSILISLFLPGWSSLLGSLFATIVGVILLVIWNRENKAMTFLEEGRRFLDMTSAVYIMPLLLSCLGTIFTNAGVGDAFATIFGKIIPQGNVYIGIVAYAVGMVLFTMIMGNAFAAITVMTVGIGVPFVISLGANPLYMVTLAMTCGYCGTLLTPMAANFNIVPGVYLEVKDKYSIIKMQLIPSILMLVFQIIYMCLMVNKPF
ncbi:MAG: DUF979 domain-containing protein [Negativibacillus massiliensis]|uniref:DUF979 domain-containing protein n=1 Tax=Negativibacillus massiliensis TaxID=1871035 RepID=UPI00033CD40F|nr:DUF979 domain-containing protein [Negativibacillus massiliensis]MCI6346741.1 DUF979 domain-containing protein [Negativibacillus massiliensis]MDY4046418.1 DUF979 domain-containing protein [Negativibacillus massiliensis]CDA79160.1 membrane protein [Clostridium sp. CAG:242]